MQSSSFFYNNAFHNVHITVYEGAKCFSKVLCRAQTARWFEMNHINKR